MKRIGAAGLLCLCAAGALGAGVDPALLAPLGWRSIGPSRGGRVLAVTGVPGEAAHFYFGAVNGGVWETRNAGRTWAPIFDDTGVGSIGAIAVAPSAPNVLYVGTGEADMRSNIAQGEGMYRSTDGGRHWQRAGLEDSRAIGRILVDPKDPERVLVAALGHPYGPNEQRGVFRSTDGGRNWRRTLGRDDSTGAIDLAADPARPEIVYAALWQTRRPPWSVYPPSSGPGGGLWKSSDGGETWAALEGHGLPAHPGRIGLATAPSRPGRVYALVDAAGGGLYRSDDGGASWTRLADDKRLWGRGWYFGGLTVDPRDADTVYVCNTAMYRSTDAGRSFVPVKGAPGGDDYHALWIDPGAPERQVLGVDQGAVVTLDGGRTWSSWFNQPTGQFYHLATDRQFPYHVVGSQQDSGAARVPSRTDHADGINLTEFRELTAGGESDNVVPDPDDPDVLFGGRVERYDLRTQQTATVDPTLAYPDLYRGAWTLPLVFGPESAHPLYFGNQRVFMSRDRGRHWQPISPDLSRPHTDPPGNLDAATLADDEHVSARRGVVYALAVSPLDPARLYAGTDDGLVWSTRDGGAHWHEITPPALGAWSKVATIEAGHFDADTLYVAVDRHRLDDPRPYVYATHDGGRSWSLIAQGLDDGGSVHSVNVVREDPRRPELLYAGSERGVYVSFDDGAHWQGLQRGLPRTSVRDLVVHDDDLVIATHGRGFWVLDDVAPLRALAVDASPATRLLPPAVALRVRPSAFTGSPMPKDEPMAANPAAGAVLDYLIAPGTAGPVTLTIRDAAGTVVRRFVSGTPATPPAEAPVAPEWYVPPPALEAAPGAHRLVWNLHRTPAPELTPEDPYEEELGLWVAPGEYALELEAGGTHSSATLTVKPDPRVTLPAAAYARAAALAADIERARIEIARASAAASRRHAELLAAARAPGAAAGLDTTAARIATLADLPPEKASPDFIGSPPRTVDGLRYLAAAFARLAAAVDGADGAPTPDAEQGYRLHRERLDRVLAEWATLAGPGDGPRTP